MQMRVVVSWGCRIAGLALMSGVVWFGQTAQAVAPPQDAAPPQAAAAAPPAGPGGPPGAPGPGAPDVENDFAPILRAWLAPLPPDAPQPATDPRDLEGTWFHGQILLTRNERDMYGNKLPFSPKGQRVRDRRVKATYVDQTPYANASAQCIPPGQPWQLDLNFPFQIYQSKNTVTFVFQEYHGIWNIRMDQPHRASGSREYMGDSVGHWDGNTLVVDTIGYKQAMWLDVDGTPASANAHLTFRIRKINYGGWKLEVVTTIDDPQMYTAPWSIVRTFAWRPNMTDFTEYNCEYQVGAPGGVSRYGLTAEPAEDNE